MRKVDTKPSFILSTSLFSTTKAVTKSGPKLLSILFLLLLLGSLTCSFVTEEEVRKCKGTEVVLQEEINSLTCFVKGNSCSKKLLHF